jgi:hypothetical protein
VTPILGWNRYAQAASMRAVRAGSEPALVIEPRPPRDRILAQSRAAGRNFSQPERHTVPRPGEGDTDP